MNIYARTAIRALMTTTWLAFCCVCGYELAKSPVWVLPALVILATIMLVVWLAYSIERSRS